jgi:hypothetical protein
MVDDASAPLPLMDATCATQPSCLILASSTTISGGRADMTNQVSSPWFFHRWLSLRR